MELPDNDVETIDDQTDVRDAVQGQVFDEGAMVIQGGAGEADQDDVQAAGGPTHVREAEGRGVQDRAGGSDDLQDRGGDKILNIQQRNMTSAG